MTKQSIQYPVMLIVVAAALVVIAISSAPFSSLTSTPPVQAALGTTNVEHVEMATAQGPLLASMSGIPDDETFASDPDVAYLNDLAAVVWSYDNQEEYSNDVEDGDDHAEVASLLTSSATPRPGQLSTHTLYDDAALSTVDDGLSTDAWDITALDAIEETDVWLSTPAATAQPAQQASVQPDGAAVKRLADLEAFAIGTSSSTSVLRRLQGPVGDALKQAIDLVESSARKRLKQLDVLPAGPATRAPGAAVPAPPAVPLAAGPQSPAAAAAPGAQPAAPSPSPAVPAAAANSSSPRPPSPSPASPTVPPAATNTTPPAGTKPTAPGSNATTPSPAAPGPANGSAAPSPVTPTASNSSTTPSNVSSGSTAPAPTVPAPTAPNSTNNNSSPPATPPPPPVSPQPIDQQQKEQAAKNATSSTSNLTAPVPSPVVSPVPADTVTVWLAMQGISADQYWGQYHQTTLDIISRLSGTSAGEWRTAAQNKPGTWGRHRHLLQQQQQQQATQVTFSLLTTTPALVVLKLSQSPQDSTAAPSTGCSQELCVLLARAGVPIAPGSVLIGPPPDSTFTWGPAQQATAEPQLEANRQLGAIIGGSVAGGFLLLVLLLLRKRIFHSCRQCAASVGRKTRQQHDTPLQQQDQQQKSAAKGTKGAEVSVMGMAAAAASFEDQQQLDVQVVAPDVEHSRRLAIGHPMRYTGHAGVGGRAVKQGVVPDQMHHQDSSQHSSSRRRVSSSSSSEEGVTVAGARGAAAPPAGVSPGIAFTQLTAPTPWVRDSPAGLSKQQQQQLPGTHYSHKHLQHPESFRRWADSLATDQLAAEAEAEVAAAPSRPSTPDTAIISMAAALPSSPISSPMASFQSQGGNRFARFRGSLHRPSAGSPTASAAPAVRLTPSGARGLGDQRIDAAHHLTQHKAKAAAAGGHLRETYHVGSYSGRSRDELWAALDRELQKVQQQHYKEQQQQQELS